MIVASALPPALAMLLAMAPDPAGPWRAVLDLAGGPLRFTRVVGTDLQWSEVRGRLPRAGDR